MNAATIEMPRDKARELFEEYRAAFRKGGDAADRALMRGYETIAKGRKVLDLHETMRAAGLDDRGCPRLAIARANAPACWFRWESSRAVLASTESALSNDRATSLRISFPESVLVEPRNIIERWRVRTSQAPLIPPRFRPPYGLRNYHLLWEAEWTPVPTRDPLLLRHLDGALYAVLAAWDLTALERAVLAGKL